jgi:sn-glycerol 3-phosphate transport system substrate-binding protein
MRDDDDVVCRVRHDQAEREVQVRRRSAAVLQRRAGAPQNTIIGGASLWVMGGKPANEYKGVAKFLTFLSQPELQAEFHQTTGYLPITMAAYELTQEVRPIYEKNPGTDVSVNR